jgi:DNA-binding CsgD family transcriptional regulator
LVDERRAADARPALRLAYDEAVRLGAEPLRREAERVARRARAPLPGGTDGGPQAGTLTRREREVLDLVGYGRTNREIARALVISERTAGVHVSRILAKLGASNRAEAVHLAACGSRNAAPVGGGAHTKDT